MATASASAGAFSGADMARLKKSDAESVAEKQGRALIDLPAHNLKSGDYASLPSEVADALSAFGLFDLKAKE
jgi:hypothetical protein